MEHLWLILRDWRGTPSLMVGKWRFPTNFQQKLWESLGDRHPPLIQTYNYIRQWLLGSPRIVYPKFSQFTWICHISAVDYDNGWQLAVLSVLFIAAEKGEQKLFGRIIQGDFKHWQRGLSWKRFSILKSWIWFDGYSIKCLDVTPPPGNKALMSHGALESLEALQWLCGCQFQHWKYMLASPTAVVHNKESDEVKRSAWLMMGLFFVKFVIFNGHSFNVPFS